MTLAPTLAEKARGGPEGSLRGPRHHPRRLLHPWSPSPLDPTGPPRMHGEPRQPGQGLVL